MSIGPAGASGLLKGSVASQAWKAGRYSGRNRLSYSSASFVSPLSLASSQKLNVLAS
jgi:hypothetical protein